MTSKKITLTEAAAIARGDLKPPTVPIQFDGELPSAPSPAGEDWFPYPVAVPKPVAPEGCSHIGNSGHPADSAIRSCPLCDARSVDGGTTWMPFIEYRSKHCLPPIPVAPEGEQVDPFRWGGPNFHTNACKCGDHAACLNPLCKCTCHPAKQVAAPDSASLVLVPRNPTPEMFAAAGGKSIANYVWRKMIAAWEDRIE